MKYKYLLLGLSLLFLFNSNPVNSQCPDDSDVRILLVGDSWAFFMGVDGTIDKVMKDWGFPEYKYYTDLDLAQNGAKTHHFLASAKQQILQNALLSRPNVEYVHLSLTGNDLLGNWKSQTHTQFQIDSLMDVTLDSLDMVVQFIKGVRPDVDIVLSGYAYPNFDEVISGFVDPLGGIIYGPEDHPFYSNWEKMQFPSNAEINEQLNVFTDLTYDFYADDPRVHFVPATGIAQYEYGQTSALEVAPYGTYPSKSVPLPYGDPVYPSPKNSMRNYELTKDCFHLSSRGFRALVGYTTQKYYHKALMDDIYFLADNAQTSGSVASDGTTSDRLYVGKYSGVEHRTILSFDTKNNLDKRVGKASIFLHRIEQTGEDNPIDGNIIVEVMDGTFGELVTIEVSDFEEVGKAEGTPCLYGSNNDGNWVRLDLPEELLEHIKPYSVTQFKITAPGVDGSVVEFSGTEDPDFAPVLNILYGLNDWAGLEEEIKQNIMIYPNPANDILHVDVDSGVIKEIEIFSIDGKKMIQTNASTISVSEFGTGAYIVRVLTDRGVSTQKFVKN